MPYVIIEAFGHDTHTDQVAYVTNKPLSSENGADFKRWVVFIEDENAAREHAAQRTISCGNHEPSAEQREVWGDWLQDVNFGE
jgi:hypothetical protein